MQGRFCHLLVFMIILLPCLTACSKQSTYPETLIPGLNDTSPNTPNINVKNFGAKGDGSTNDDSAINIALRAAHEKKLPLFFPAGKYNTRIILPFDSLRIFGEKVYGRFFDSSGTVILGLINCNAKKHISLSDLSIDSRGRLLSTDDAALSSGTYPGNQALDHTFVNMAILGNGYYEYKHGILCFSGSGIQMNNIYVAGFYHGIALRCSDVALQEISAESCGFTSIVVKSADSLNEHVQNISIRRVSIYGDPKDLLKRGGTILVMSYNAKSLTENVIVDSVSSVNGSVGAINVEQDSGLVRNIHISNCFARNCGERNTRAAYDITGGTDIIYTNCQTDNCAGIGFRSSNNPVNLVVKDCYESRSHVFPWMGTYKYLQLNGVEIYNWR